MFRQVLSSNYWWLVGAVHHLIGTRLYESKWKDKAKSKEVVMAEISHPHRQWLFDQITHFTPFYTILEIGCGYGPNVEIIATKLPCVNASGLDISQNSVDEGNRRLSQQGLDNAYLVHGKAYDLSLFDD